MRRLASVLVLAAACAAPATSRAPAPASTARAPDPAAGPIAVGVFAPISDGAAGADALAGIELAFAEVNRTGGVRGRRVELRVADTVDDPLRLDAEVTRLIDEERVVALIGDVTGAMSALGAAIAEEREVPLIAPLADIQTSDEFGNLAFRGSFVDWMEAEVMARYAHEQLGLDAIAILPDLDSDASNDRGVWFHGTWRDLSDDEGRGHFWRGAPTVTQLRDLVDAGAQAVYLPTPPEVAARLAREARAAGLTVPLLGDARWSDASPELLADLEGAYHTAHFVVDDPRPAARGFVAAFEAAHGRAPTAAAALGHDSARVLLEAMQRAPSLHPSDLAEAIAQTRLEGATGTIRFDSEGATIKPVTVVRVRGGVASFAATLAP